ncbi:TetR/AcrR family transcriptional regulator [Mycolicibacterium farcinogenes]|uniref:TetR/AcrR family transcriptional regulator n=1 Tax=Mycolicibacterium farcinogenes TaxID=1802 RepID=UPI001C8E0055|nr:TetR/AcrR family transcriptional regulator [Mycolicibacterium farcinogenes]QZH60919.1 TetR/AcrR family transcriptional regulator [Mycolicibacterium farcinogenes]
MPRRLPPGKPTPRQTELFDALVDLFLSEGFAHLTLDDISTRLKCSKTTLYSLADSKEQLVRSATAHFFRRATAQIDAQTVAVTNASERITTYLAAAGQALSVASEQFMADLDAFAPAREVYEQNTAAAALRVQEMITDGVASGDLRHVHAGFAADLATAAMARIQRGEVRATTGLGAGQAYQELAAILTTGISA